MNLPFAETFQHILWFGLLALGVQFLAIAARLREDRTLPMLGGNIVLLMMMVGLDVWVILPGLAAEEGSISGLEAAQDLYQVVACAYVAVSLWFVRGLTGRPSRGATRAVTAAFSLLALGFWVDALSPARLFVYLEDWKWNTTPAYDFAFAPVLVGAFAWALWMTFSGWRRAQGQDKRTLGHLCLAYAILLVSGLMDLAALWTQATYAYNFVLYGTLGMGVVATFIFTDKLIRMYERRRGTLLEIAEIRGKIEAQRPLGELGKSALQVSDEIRSYVSLLKRDSINLGKEVGGAGERVEIRRIDEARRRLERYASGILEYSSSSRLGPLAPADPGGILENCVRERFASESGRIAVVASAGTRVMADRSRLERALGELLANALEAGAPWIEARVRAGLGFVSIAIEDSGRGCAEELCDAIPQPFFTTRKAQGQHGLGASIAVAIARAHGGSLRFLARPGGGLIANMLLPAAGEYPAGAREGVTEAALISADRLRIFRFQALCGNLGLRPVILAPGASARSEGWPLCVLVEAGSGAEVPAAWRHAPCRMLDAEGRMAGDPAAHRPARPLSEEAMLEWLAPG